MAKFNNGDRVRTLNGLGTVLGYGYFGNIGVEHDEYMSGHSCGDHKHCLEGKDGHCWFYVEDDIELVKQAHPEVEEKLVEKSCENSADRVLQSLNDLLELYEGNQPMLKKSIEYLLQAYLDQVNEENK